MKSLRSISIIALLIAGCVSIKPQHVTRDKSVTRDEGVTRHASRVTNFFSPATSHLFKATLDIRKHHLTGLLVVKRMDTLPPTPPQTGRGEWPGIYRIVFMNEIGLTFFDLEMKTDSFKVISCFESLNKSALMKILETNFRMLTWSGPLKNETPYIQDGTKNIVRSGMAGKYKTWQTFSPSGDTLYTTSSKSNIFDPAIISFAKYSEGFPVKIILENPFIGMKMTLRKLVQ
ncbi:MAG: hypothetical protein NTW16_05080 [Bacteroidetes bacterium]|nr:hypothetical protein [Bacteroidota bacterium]